jgi:hypothetical protein
MCPRGRGLGGGAGTWWRALPAEPVHAASQAGAGAGFVLSHPSRKDAKDGAPGPYIQILQIAQGLCRLRKNSLKGRFLKALYQGMTSVMPKKPQKNSGLSPRGTLAIRK